MTKEQTEIKILEIALNKMSLALDNVISECLDERGKPKTPDHRVIMKTRGLLPPYCTNSFK